MMTKAGGNIPGSSARCDQCRKRHRKCDLSEPQCRRCQKSGLICSGPRPLAVYVHRYANSFNAHTQRAVLIQAYQRRSTTKRHSEQFFKTTMPRIRYLRSLLAEHQWSSSLAIGQNVRLCSQASYTFVYQALLSDFKPKRDGIFGGDRTEDTELKHYSNIATCIRALLPLSSLSIPTIDNSLLSLLSLYYSSLHGDAGLEKLAYSTYTVALGQYSRLLNQFLSKVSEVSTYTYQTFIYISIAMEMFEQLRTVATQVIEHQPHLHGALNTLQCCGPRLVQTSLTMHKAFSGLRGVAVFAAIEQREKMFLAEPDWLDIPFENIIKSMRDHLIDVGVHIPGLLRYSDLFFASITTEYTIQGVGAGLSLLERVTDLQQKLEAWLSKLKMTTSQPLYWFRNSPIAYDSKHRNVECIPVCSNMLHQLCFLSGPIAGLLVDYWSFAIQISMASIEIQQRLLSYVDQAPEQTLLRETLSHGLRKERELADGTAQLIIEAEPYISSCFEGLTCLDSPLRHVARYFKNTNAPLSSV